MLKIHFLKCGCSRNGARNAASSAELRVALIG
jgi:hypothetical protein